MLAVKRSWHGWDDWGSQHILDVLVPVSASCNTFWAVLDVDNKLLSTYFALGCAMAAACATHPPS